MKYIDHAVGDVPATPEAPADGSATRESGRYPRVGGVYGDIGPVSFRHRVGVVVSMPTPFPRTISDNVAYGLKLRNENGGYDRIVGESRKLSALGFVTASHINDLIAEPAGTQITNDTRQAVCVPDRTVVFPTGGELVEFDDTEKIFENPESQRVEDYITGKFG